MFWKPRIPTRFDQVIEEKTGQRLLFNVMPGRMIQEDLHFTRYQIADRYIEGHFDRQYASSMERSPSHLIFLSALIHWQKLTYIYCCRHFGLKYEPNGRELMKIWPLKISVHMPAMLRDENGLVQRVWERRIRQVRKGVYIANGFSEVGPIRLKGKTAIFLSKTRQ